eukprot:768372-Hanusia_phi.AAC.5
MWGAGQRGGGMGMGRGGGEERLRREDRRQYIDEQGQERKMIGRGEWRKSRTERVSQGQSNVA